MKIVLSTLNAKFTHSSLALYYLAAYLPQTENTVVIKEYSINNEALSILSEIYREQPAIIGFACYIWNIEMTLKLVSALKKVLPQIIIILGGPEVSYDPKQVLQQNSAVDYVIMGEGEEVFAALIKSLTTGIKAQNISGLAYRLEDCLVVEGEPQVIKALDSIPFPYDTARIHELKDKIVYYETSRGCPFSCKYCLSSTTHGVRYFSINRVLQNLAFFISHKVRQVKLVDRTFNIRKEHYWPIFKFIADQNCDTNFHFEITADILEDDVLELLKTVPAGRVQFEIGIQSTNPVTLAACGRNNNWPAIVKNVTKLKFNRNIHLHLDLIVGLPYESYEQFRISFNDVYGLQPDMLQIGFLKLLKGSNLRAEAPKHSYISMDVPPYEVLSNSYIYYAQIRQLKMLEKVFEYYYNSGKFKYSLKLLVSLFKNDAYKFFADFTQYWEDNGLNLIGHNTIALFSHLNNFTIISKCDYLEVIQEFLKFDVLLCERGNIRPEFLSWERDAWSQACDAFWRNNTLINQYLPGYSFTNWRELKRNFHIEVFKINIVKYFDKQPESVLMQLTPILFSYNNNYPEFQIIEASDFFDKKGQ